MSDLADLYREQLIEAAQDRSLFGTLESPSCRADAHNPSCGDALSVEVRVSKAGQIESAQWQGYGCAVSTAATHLVLEESTGKMVKDVLEWDEEKVLSLLGLEKISAGRKKCMMLGLSVLQEALSSYKKTENT